MMRSDVPTIFWLFAVNLFGTAFCASAMASCDINGDGVCDAGEIDAMSQMVLDGTAHLEDRTALIVSPMPKGFNTYFGDSNLNGVFDEQDIVSAFAAGRYLTGELAGWAAGDWDGNLRFDEQDFVVAFAAGGYLQGPRGATAIPEPSIATLLCLGFMSLLAWRTALRR